MLTAASDPPPALWSPAGGVAGEQQGQGYHLQGEGLWLGRGEPVPQRGSLAGRLLLVSTPSPTPPPCTVESRLGRGFSACHPLCHFVDLVSLSLVEQRAKIH